MLGGAVTPTIEALRPVACTITQANAENLTYTNAFAAGTFTGAKADDLEVRANRERIFAPLLATLRRQQADVAALKPSTPEEKALVTAALADVKASIQLMDFDRRWAPTDASAPLAPDVFPTDLDEAISSSSQDVRQTFDGCTLPAETLRRQKAYGG